MLFSNDAHGHIRAIRTQEYRMLENNSWALSRNFICVLGKLLMHSSNVSCIQLVILFGALHGVMHACTFGLREGLVSWYPTDDTSCSVQKNSLTSMLIWILFPVRCQGSHVLYDARISRELLKKLCGFSVRNIALWLENIIIQLIITGRYGNFSRPL
jgi:hypothetical protein